MKMKACMSASIGLFLAAAAPALAANLFSDDFNNGVNGSAWEVVPGTYNQILIGDNSHAFGAQSARQVAADPWVYYMRTISGTHPSAGILTGNQREVLTTWMWDDGNNLVSGPQTAAGVMLSEPNTSGANDFYQISVNSVQRYNDYNWRTSAQGTFDTGVARSQGWHEFQIVVDPYTGNNDVHFWIDGNLVASGNRKAGSGSGYVMDEIRLGISIKSPGSDFWYDNVSLDLVTVPEPSSLTLLGLGGLALLLPRWTARKRG